MTGQDKQETSAVALVSSRASGGISYADLVAEARERAEMHVACTPAGLLRRLADALGQADARIEALEEALGWIRALAEDERLHDGVSDDRFYVPGCEACDVIAAIDKALTEDGAAVVPGSRS